ncbi:MAG TPA: family 78 glycoside hydrolase catalytic domain [Lachnospiraceae bacterium]|nr:family 78 glycoside hydrolase catalytic domain [Lachnospiraceae bacterium]
MRITSMKCNRIENPIGYTLDKPRLSWITEGEGATTQIGCQVQVAEDKAFLNILFDSGKKDDIDSISFPLPVNLEPCTIYYWRVRVWTDNGDVSSPVSWFETSKMDQPWVGKWITPDWDDRSIHPLLRKSFKLNNEVEKARLYICGLGLYEAEINGERVGDEYLTPYCNSYDNWIQYQTFDVTDLLRKGDNVVGALLGNGWYKGRFGFMGDMEGHYGDEFAFLCELHITYTDGSTESIYSDESWKATSSHILESNIYDGEMQDANKYIESWSCASTSDAYWVRVRLIDMNFKILEARRSLPVRIKERIKPVKVINTPKGEIVLDMGQNMVGWISFKTKAPKGSVIYLQYGEEMQNGCFYRDNLRSAKAEFRYISNGQPKEVRPHFTYYGFRYVKVEGWPGEIELDDFIGCVLYSDLERIGHIETSNPMINRLFLNALWGQKGNFLDVPTDCPQRDERMGWTGDAQMFSGTACFNMDSDAFFHKYLYDLAKEQASLGGIVPHTVPSFGMSKKDENNFLSGGSCAWSEAATVIPWNLYLHYGDKAILKQQLSSMKDYVDYIRRQDDGSRLWNTGFHFGDWLALDGKGDFDPYGGTPTDLIATAFYSYSAELVAKAAKVLGKNDMADEYHTLSVEVREAFCEEFVTPRGRLTSDTQTAYILALYMDLVPEKYRGRIIELLRKNLECNNYYLKTGFVGTPYICRVLSENGYNDLAYRLLLNEEYPSWLYEIKLGATTIWERWNSLLADGTFGELGMNSLNHYTYGSIVEWMYRNMCGINPLEESPGFRKIRLAPQPNRLIKHAKATVNTAVGLYESGWCYEEKSLHYQFLIPFNAQAELVLADIQVKDVIVNGVSLDKTNLDYLCDDDKVRIVLKTGRYEIIVPAGDVE